MEHRTKCGKRRRGTFNGRFIWFQTHFLMWFCDECVRVFMIDVCSSVDCFGLLLAAVYRVKCVQKTGS